MCLRAETAEVFVEASPKTTTDCVTTVYIFWCCVLLRFTWQSLSGWSSFLHTLRRRAPISRGFSWRLLCSWTPATFYSAFSSPKSTRSSTAAEWAKHIAAAAAVRFVTVWCSVFNTENGSNIVKPTQLTLGPVVSYACFPTEIFIINILFSFEWQHHQHVHLSIMFLQ